jgi:hypothetical protein
MSNFVFLNRKITQTEKCAFQKKNHILIKKKKSNFKNQIFWTIFFEKLKISHLLFVWMLKKPISTKKSNF